VAKPYVLGIDVGTESCRAGVIDLAGNLVAHAAEPYPTRHLHPGWAEQDPLDWWQALGRAAQAALAKAGAGRGDVIGLSADATTMTVVAANRAGVPLRPALLWMDVRAAGQAARAMTTDDAARRYNAGGTGPASAEWYPFKAAWLKENEPAVFAAADVIVDATDWLTHRLTGRWAVNINSAALRMYYNRDLGGWPADFYDHVGAGGALAKLPERITALGEAVGGLAPAAAAHLGLNPGIPVGQGATDASQGVIGLGVVEPGRSALITGSSHAIFGQAAAPVWGEGFWGGYTDAIVPGQYTVEGGQVSTGSVMKWFKDQFARDVAAEAKAAGTSPYDILNREAAAIPAGSEGLIVNEYFQGNRTPYTDGKARGIIWGLTLAHTRAHVYHAIQEGICYGAAHILRAMAAAGFTTREFVVAGGMTKSRGLLQLHADITGVPLTLTAVQDGPLLGGAISAAVAAGVHPDIPTAARAMVHDVETIQPDPGRHSEYEFYVDQYCAGYPALRPHIHALADHEAGRIAGSR
jgi:FGGY-family pentulose kinase